VASRLEILRFEWTLLSRARQRAVIATAAVLALLVLVTLFEGISTHGRILRGVSVAGVPVGGLTPSEAASRLAPVADALKGQVVRASGGGHSFEIEPAKVAFAMDVGSTVDRAYRLGRESFLARGLGQRVRSWFGGLSVSPAVTYERRGLTRLVAAIARRIDIPARDAQIIDIDGHPAAVPGANGVALDRSKTAAALLAALASRAARDLVLPVKVSSPRISTDAARAAAAELDIAISSPIRLVYGPKRWVIASRAIRRWMTVTPKATSEVIGSPLTLVVAPATPAIQSTIESVTASVTKPAVDAKFDVSGDHVRVVPSKTGLAVDTKAASDLIERQLKEAGGQRIVQVTLHSIEPKMTTDRANAMGIRDKISSFATQYSSGNAPRANNIHLLAAALNNTLLPPSEEFSFNKTIGPRTAAKGYQEAPVIMNGKLVPALGGGICQVGTTIFNAVFFSGLPVTERTNHSFYISHYPDGRDATVSWDGPDFRFRNDTSSWILMKAGWSSDSVTISLYGTNPGYSVSYTTGKWTGVTHFSVQQVDDPKLAKGTFIVEDVGVNGHDVTVTRIVKKDGKLIRRDDFTSHYSAKDQVTRVGTKYTPPPPPPPPPSKPTTRTHDGTGTAGH
jgi:vancomycin resistance protein YoaR